MNALAGTGSLIRLIVRRDRIRLPVWALGVTGFVVGTAQSFTDVFASPAVRQSRAELMATPMMRAFNGPGHGLDDYTIGAMVANELLVIAAIAVALMSIFLVIRHTRAEEETGRAELVRSSVVGANAAPTAVLAVASAANLILGGLTAMALTATAQELQPMGSWAFGMSMAAVGIVFAAAAAVAAQVTEHARGATGIGAIALTVAFTLRALGDAADGTLSWLSPIGWAQATRAYVDERWWPLLLSVAFAAVLTATAFALATRRDVGAGLVPPRPGPPSASDLLVHPMGLALRLHRSSMAAWATGLLLFGVAFGGVIGEMDVFLQENPQLEQILGPAESGMLLDAFLATIVLIMALIATGYAISAALRMRSEETSGRAEPLLATPLPRTRWASGHLAMAVGGSATVLLAGALGLGLAAAFDQGEPRMLTDVLAAGLVHVPAVWLIVGIVTAAFGLVPRAVAVGWALLAYAIFVGLMADPLGLPDLVRNLSPYAHVPALPGAQLAPAPILGLALIAATLISTGLITFRGRDINIT